MTATARARAAKRYTWDDFVALDDEDKRELVDGQLVEVEVPTKWHELIVTILSYHLHGWARTRKLRVLASAYKVKVREDRGAMPDVQVVKESVYRRSANDQGLVHGRPELVVEVVSPSSRQHDRVRKVEWYASIGVPEYWIVDVDDRLVQRLVLKRKQYVLAQQVAGDEVFEPASMKGLSIPLAEIWAAIDPPKRKRKRRG
ncbi:MAG: Uma2 family endonuclease [Sandaracinaceae bacterium]|nr:Uma2 family endonuclease [Sandaracinaceae bacterium]